MARFDLEGATILVTGGSRGIGPYIAAALASRGARIGLIARTGDELQHHLDLPRIGLVSPEKVGAAAVKAVEKDRAEMIVMPGPGKALRAGP